MAEKKEKKTTAAKKPPVKKKPARKAKRGNKATAAKKQPAGFPIVGIGASAGGLEALETFFSHMPHDSNIAFVVIQHLSPRHKSIMGSLLAKYTEMEALEWKEGGKR